MARARLNPLGRLGPIAKWLSKSVKKLNKRFNFYLLDSRARIRRTSLTNVTFVGVTGSCGKTTTTRLI